MTFLKFTLILRNVQRRGRTGENVKRTGQIDFFVFRSKEEKEEEKAANAALVEEYGYCKMDGHREKIGNFRCLSPKENNL